MLKKIFGVLTANVKRDIKYWALEIKPWLMMVMRKHNMGKRWFSVSPWGLPLKQRPVSWRWSQRAKRDRVPNDTLSSVVLMACRRQWYFHSLVHVFGRFRLHGYIGPFHRQQLPLKQICIWNGDSYSILHSVKKQWNWPWNWNMSGYWPS